MVVPVEWLAKRPIEEAVWEKGLFASQLIVCKLRDEHTIKTVRVGVRPWLGGRLIDRSLWLKLQIHSN